MARRNGVSGASRDRGEEVYAAALRLFREKGYHATSMQDIAAAVGLYKGSLYHYIDGKEELLARVFERGMGALLAEVECIAADTTVVRVCSFDNRRGPRGGRRRQPGRADGLPPRVARAGWRLAGQRARPRSATPPGCRNRRARGAGGRFRVPDVGIATLGLLGM
jgi:AcrR family transcriptional regulator